MARTALTVQEIDPDGVELAYEAVNADGHSAQNDGRVGFEVVNADTGDHVVTIVTPGSVEGLAIADRTITVPAGESRHFGRYTPNIYNQPDRTVHLNFDDPTGLTIAAFRL